MHIADLLAPNGVVLRGGASSKRQALHAVRLSLRHPLTGEMLTFHSTPPLDMQLAIAQSGLRYNPQGADSDFFG